MSSNFASSKLKELKPRITVIGVGGAGGNAINNMIASGIDGVDFIAANTDAQALISSSAERRIQLGADLTEGLGAGAKPEIGEAAANEAIAEIRAAVEGSHMVFIAAGMGGGTGTGAASVIAKVSRELGILTVAIVTKPFNFEGAKRLRTAEGGIELLRDQVDTLIVIPNQNLFRIANERTTFAEAFVLADQVLHSGIACITDLIVREGLINLDFADVRAVMAGMGTAMMGTGEAAGERRAVDAAELAILNPLLDDVSLRGAKGLLVSISGSRSLTLYEVDEAASRVRQEVDPDANVIIGATFDETLGDKIRVSIVASGLQSVAAAASGRANKTASQPAPQPSLGMMRAQEPLPQLQPATDSYNWNLPPEGAYAAQAEAPTFAERVAAEQGWQAQPEEFYQQDEALGAASNRSAWRAPNDVLIEPNQPAAPRAAQPWAGEAQNPGSFGEPAPAFRPQPPLDGRRPGRRLPEVEDFPQFAQQAYRSKRVDAAAQPPVAPAATERKRGGLLDFLTGRKPATVKSGESVSKLGPNQRQSRGARFNDPASAEGDLASPPDAPATLAPHRIPMPRHRPRQA